MCSTQGAKAYKPLAVVEGWLLGEIDEGVGGGHIITVTDEPIEGCEEDTTPVRILVLERIVEV